MKFISVRRLAAVLKLELSRTDDKLTENLRNSVDKFFIEKHVLTAFSEEFTQKQVVFVLNQLKVEHSLNFHHRVEEDPILVEYLFSKGETILPDEEIKHPEEDQLLKAYQDFLEPYLAPILNEKTKICINKGELVELTMHLKFSPLLSETKRIEIQQPVRSYLNQLLGQIKVSQGKELNEKLLLVYSHEFVEVLNELDSYFYKELLAYFSTTKLIVQRNDLSPLVLDRIKTSLSNLNLKKGDYEQINAFIDSETFNLRRKKPRSNLEEMVRSPFFIVAVIVILVNLLVLECEGDGVESDGVERIDRLETIENEAVSIGKNQFPFIVDTAHFESTNRNLEEKNFSNFHPLYFGEKSDTLYIDYDLASYANKKSEIFPVLEDKDRMKQNRINAELFNKERENYSDYYTDLNLNFNSIPPTWEEAEIKITIDTSQLIRNIGRTKYKNDEFVYTAHPVILENMTDGEILIGYGSQIPLILEIREANGEWKALEFQYIYACGNGLSSIALPKGEIVLTSVALVDLEDNSELRLKLGGNFSEGFWIK